MDNFKCVIPSWEEIQLVIKKTAEEIKKSDFHPDVIVAIARGGLVPARVLGDFLLVKDIYSMKADHWGLTATKDGQAKISHELNKDLTGKKVLIVDDITDTGQSMDLAKESIAKLNPAVLKTSTVYHIETSKYEPDFYGDKIAWSWVIWPWNYREDLVNIIRKITKNEEKNLEDLKNDLKLTHDIDTEIEELKELMEHISYLDSVK